MMDWFQNKGYTIVTKKGCTWSQKAKHHLKRKKIDNILLEELELSVRAYNCLKRSNVHTLKDLLQYSQEDLLELKNFGQKSASEVCASLESRFGQTLPKRKL